MNKTNFNFNKTPFHNKMMIINNKTLNFNNLDKFSNMKNELLIRLKISFNKNFLSLKNVYIVN